MTADVGRLVRIPRPDEIADDPLMQSGLWADGQGRNLVQFLTFHLSRAEARRVLDEADDIRLGLRQSVAPAKTAAPTVGVDTVWPDGHGVDHDPVPMRQATVCGLLITPPMVYDKAGGVPCPNCYQGAVS